MKSGRSDLNAIQDLNAIVLKAEELSKVINDYNRVRTIGICSRMTGGMIEAKTYDEIPDKAEVILIRLRALAVMMENSKLKNWLPADGNRVIPAIAHRAVISAAANHPLSIINGCIAFETESFLRRILELAEPEGNDSN